MKNEAEAKQVVEDILSRGVGEYFDPEDKFKEKLMLKLQGKYPEDIVVKFGVDTTRPDIHLGHAVVLRKLRAMQDAGCKIIFLIGDFTTQIGDPTGKSKVRPELSQEEIEKNLKTYLDQVGKILRVERDVNGNILHTNTFSWVRNSDWFVGVTDIAVDEGKTVNVAFTGAGADLSLPGNSFLGKAAVYESTRMQRTQLGKSEMVGVTLITLLSVLRRITHAQLIERDMFQQRLKSGESLYMHEMMYPVIQALDSVMLARIYGSCDLEIGGTDQTFNLLMGRKVMEMSALQPQAVMSMKLLVGTDGKEKMSKSLDNYIAVNDSAADIYGKVMSLSDSVMPEYFELATYTPLPQVHTLASELSAQKVNPRDLKMMLARQITEIYHGKGGAEVAERSFIETFQNKGVPEQIPEISADKDELLSDVLVRNQIISSKTEFRRLLEAGAIKLSGEVKIDDPYLKITKPEVYKIGKHQFVRITPS